MLTPKGKEAEEGGCLPPARLELSKSLQMHLGLPIGFSEPMQNLHSSFCSQTILIFIIIIIIII